MPGSFIKITIAVERDLPRSFSDDVVSPCSCHYRQNLLGETS